MGVGQPRRRLDLLVRRIQPAVTEIFPNRLRKEIGVLQDYAQGMAEALFPNRPDVPAVDPNRSLIDVVEAGQQVDNRRLTRPGGPTKAIVCPGAAWRSTSCRTGCPAE